MLIRIIITLKNSTEIKLSELEEAILETECKFSLYLLLYTLFQLV